MLNNLSVPYESKEGPLSDNCLDAELGQRTGNGVENVKRITGEWPIDIVPVNEVVVNEVLATQSAPSGRHVPTYFQPIHYFSILGIRTPTAQCASGCECDKAA